MSANRASFCPYGMNLKTCESNAGCNSGNFLINASCAISESVFVLIGFQEYSPDVPSSFPRASTNILFDLSFQNTKYVVIPCLSSRILPILYLQ